MTNHPQAASDEKILKSGVEKAALEAELIYRHKEDGVYCWDLHNYVEDVKPYEFDNLRRFSSILLANAESEHREALAAKDAEHKAQIEKILDMLKQEQEWNLSKTQKITKQNEALKAEREANEAAKAVRGMLVEALSRYTTTNLDHNFNCPLSFEGGGTRRDSKCECGVDELDAAVEAALSAAQALDKKEG